MIFFLGFPESPALTLLWSVLVLSQLRHHISMSGSRLTSGCGIFVAQVTHPQRQLIIQGPVLLLVGPLGSFFARLARHLEVSVPSQQRADNPIISQFSPSTYDAFVRSPRPAECVMKLNPIDPKREIVNIDVRRCGGSSLVSPTEHWPVFSRTN